VWKRAVAVIHGMAANKCSLGRVERLFTSNYNCCTFLVLPTYNYPHSIIQSNSTQKDTTGYGGARISHETKFKLP
ncbi:hypothetical protein L9F63_012471, partial [Diploptera punctata]